MNKFLGFLLIWIVFLAGRAKVEVMFGASFMALVLSLVWTLRSAGRFVHEWQKPSFSLFQDTIGLGLKSYIICLLSFLVLRVDLLMVKYLLGTEQAGYYSVAAGMADVCLTLPVAVGTILFPKLSAMPELSGRIALTRRATLATAAAIAPLLLCAGILSAPTVRLLFGQAFLPSAAAFVWLIPGVFALALEIVMVQLLNSTGFPVSVIAVWVLTVIANIVANFWAIPAYGIVGASVVSSITYALAFALILLLIQNRRLAVRA